MTDLIDHYLIDSLTVRTYATEHGAAHAAAQRAADIVRHAVNTTGAARIVLATGNSQLAFIQALADQPNVRWGRVTVFHLDEYIGLSADHPASFRRWITHNAVEPLAIGMAHFIDGTAADPDAECRRYAGLLRAAPLDLVCMGIGENGHLAFNEPDATDFDDPSWVRVITLDDRSRRQQVTEGHFPDVEAVPEQAISMTIPAMCSARTIQVVAPERRKAPAVRAALTDPISPTCPATILRRQRNATLFLDRNSAALLDDTTSTARAAGA